MTRVALICLLFMLPGVQAADGDVSRSVNNPNVGVVRLVAPKDWQADVQHHARFGTTFYRLSAPQKNFHFELMINDLANMQMDALVNRNLETFLESSMAEDAKQYSVEGKAKAVRFGARKDGVYARLTAKAPKPGEWMYYTQGMRLSGKNVVLFTFSSNDKTDSDLKKALEIVDSVQFEG